MKAYILTSLDLDNTTCIEAVFFDYHAALNTYDDYIKHGAEVELVEVGVNEFEVLKHIEAIIDGGHKTLIATNIDA